MSFLEVTAQLANGFVTTLLIFGVTLVGAIPLGLLITLGSMSKIPPVKWIFKIFVWIIRGTPLMLQIILVFYGPGLMGLGVKFDRLLAVILAFIINYACYFSVPPMGNEIITLVKDTSLARVIAVVELVKAAETIVSLKSLIWPLFYVGAFYLLFTGIVTLLLNYAEKKLNYYQG